MRREFLLVAVLLTVGAHRAALAAEPAPAAAAPQRAAPERPEDWELDVWEYVVDGNTVLEEGKIADTLQLYLGPNRTPDDIDRARESLESAYHAQGYKTVTVSIPKQTVREGVVHLVVTEGRVANLKVVGSRFHSLDLIRSQAPSMAEGKVPDFDAMREDIVMLNQMPDRRVTPSLRAGRTPGTVDIDLAVSDDFPLHGTAELNNRYSQGTTELRSLATLSYDNLWQRGHSLSLSYQTAPKKTEESTVVFGSYLARFHDSRFSLLFSALESDSEVATVGGINVVGNGRTIGLRGLWTLPSSASMYQSLSAGIDYKRYDTIVLLDGNEIDTPLEYYPMTLAYTALLQRAPVMLSGDLRMSFASQELGSNVEALDDNRTFNRGQQFSLRGGLDFTYTLPWRFEANARVSGQWTDQPLVTNEQFAVGGGDTVRAYYEAEVLGDYGAAYGAELRMPSPSTSWLGLLQFFVFYDAATVKSRDVTGGAPDGDRLSSYGGGLNLELLSHLHGIVYWAMALDDGPATERDSSRVQFRVWCSF